MKHLLLFGIALVIGLTVFGQPNDDSCRISRRDLVGIWQRDSRRVGNGLLQNFRFYGDGTFVVNFTNMNEDARGIIAIRGKYRLSRDRIFLTTLYRTVREGGTIVPTGSNQTYLIFTIEGARKREIKEESPKEIPIYIILHPDWNIELSNESYYKLKEEDLKSLGIDPKAH